MKKDNMKEKYKERLKKILDKKFDTTMIYPLSQFEAAFGEIWGDGLPEEKLTDQQKIMRTKWNECRNNILNLGNQQKRNARAELEQHEVVWQRYSAILVPTDEYNGNK